MGTAPENKKRINFIDKINLPPKELSERVKKFGCHKIIVTFDPTNFLLYNYWYDGDMTNIMIIENHKKELMYASDYNIMELKPGSMYEVIINSYDDVKEIEIDFNGRYIYFELNDKKGYLSFQIRQSSKHKKETQIEKYMNM